MPDPLSEVVQMLRPRDVFSKRISGAGAWGVRYTAFGQPGFSVVLEGSCRLAVENAPEIILEPGDFVLLPSTPEFELTGFTPVEPVDLDPRKMAADDLDADHTNGLPPDVRLLGGTFVFDSPDAALLSSLLPPVVHVRGVEHFQPLVSLVADEALADKPGRELVLRRLVEILLVEALRSDVTPQSPPGLLRGLADRKLAPAVQQMHEHLARPWTVSQLADAAALSRSAFFDRFTKQVGMPPMEYLTAWRMAVARDLLRHEDLGMQEVGRRTGYSSASAFSTAFTRYSGETPSQYARRSAAGQASHVRSAAGT
ncbi:helix-turn-helix domain-containing protein [Pimelobacter simplex]|uniref:Transcriptional regulator, AraC family n=1 Tax=Nocardioides simplex TaxID=2045 RepID=A0A0A1DPL2_NOCSI|nr:AraC family transcriptional regulator [Pimelobacter simplex]AIY19319.1 Transcriptional regulator, AraC family [Pimelobacter simplex]MCG8149434.1 helix-turn-helix domain-containing protein [Pimelobacter simplex]GEB16195.1 transcriptional regulator [Pimelobacter simplex]SFM19160.1 Helix-turn-helix domain-containing protein [Pimelobacter simplex]